MARLELIRFTPHRIEIQDGHVRSTPATDRRVIIGLPQLFWENGSPWREANLWALERASTRGVSLRTVQTSAMALHRYANWLEKAGINWWSFPIRKADRCLVRYRGALIDARDNGTLAPSTTSQSMRVTIAFYRWLATSGLLSPAWPMWREQVVGIRLSNSVGLDRTLAVRTTDLRIPNRAAPGERLEDGLLPVRMSDRDAILALARKHASEELFLMLTLGFFTGMRLGTLCDLKIRTLTNAVPDPAAKDLYRIAVGPGADPPVATKFSVTGQIWITRDHLDELLRYAHSARRLKREAIAPPSHKDLVFLTKFGTRFTAANSGKSGAINVEMCKLRKIGAANGLSAIGTFRFHQSRCTYATQLARILIQTGSPINAIAIVREALLHKDEATSLKYIKFIEKAPVKENAANTFTREFLGTL